MTATVRGSTWRRAAVVPCLLALVVVSAACGSDVDKGPKPALAGAETKVGTGTTLYGLVVTDGAGRTLYQFDGDRGGQSACYGACAETWQPYVAEGEVQLVDPNLNALEDQEIVLAPRQGSAQQVSYGGHPLYYFAGDQRPGDVNGAGQNQFGGRWTAVSTQGGPVYP